MGDVPSPVDQNTHLAADLPTDLGELTGELVREQTIRRQAALVQTLDRADLAGLQAMGIAEDLDTRWLPCEKPGA
jgi:hypothetical protein